MIHTILDTDLYKFTTSYAYIKAEFNLQMQQNSD